MDDLTPAEKARQGRNHYEREKRKADPAKRKREKAAQQRYWARYYDEILKPKLDEKMKKENEV